MSVCYTIPVGVNLKVPASFVIALAS